MALQCLRLRRALPLLNTKRALSSAITNTCPKPTFDLTQPHQHQNNNQWRLFRSSAILLSIPIPPRPRPSSYNRDNNYDQISSEEKISPDAILFEGCDYNHWLITMDFPKDPKPSPEEMVETYVQTAAKVLGSVEEAKRKIYACSTTTYQGFQVEVTEEMSEKFRGLPGVVFILPDSYIDPVNKEYGGDKYVNGTIIPRPPPVQYGRNQGGRFNDRNRDFNRPNRPRGQYQQGNAPYDNQGPMQGNFGAQQNAPPPQYSGPPRDFRAQQNIPPPQFSGPPREFGGQHNPPPQFSGPPREFGAQQNHPPPQFSGPPRDFGAQHNPPPPQFSAPPRDFMAQQNSTAPKFPIPPRSVNNGPGGWDNYQRDRREPVPSYQANYNQGETGHYHQGQRDFQPGDQRNYAPPQGGNYGQGAGGIQGQESGYIQSDMGHGENQRFSQRDPRDNAQGQQRNYEAVGDTGTSQGRY